jgi:hypothetical protein
LPIREGDEFLALMIAAPRRRPQETASCCNPLVGSSISRSQQARSSWDGRALEFAGTPHPPAMIVQPGEQPRLLESQNRALGLLELAVNGEGTIEVPLQAGDRVVIHKDGLNESFNSLEEELGIDGLSEIVREASKRPLPETKQTILDCIAAWQDGPPADDPMEPSISIWRKSRWDTILR